MGEMMWHEGITISDFCCGTTAEKKKEEPTMKVSYNGFTGELVKIERRKGLDAVIPGYNLEIWDDEKKVSYSFNGVRSSDLKFIGGAVSFV